MILVGAQRLDLATGAVQGQEVQCHQPFAQRMGVDQFGQLAHDLGMPPTGQGLFHSALHRGEPELIEASALRDHETELTEIGQDLAPPEVERRTEVLLLDEALELPSVDDVGIDVEHVTPPGRAERLVGQHLAQLGDVLLERLRRGGRRETVPDVLDEPVGGDDAPHVHQQPGQHGPLTSTAERHRAAVAGHLEPPQDAEPHLPLPRHQATPAARRRRSTGSPPPVNR